MELNEAESGKTAGIAILSFISVVTLIFYFFVKNALAVIRVSLLTSEKKITDVQLFRCLLERS